MTIINTSPDCPIQLGYESEGEALKEFFRQAGQAVDSTHLTDSVSLLSKEGFEIKHEVFLHDAPVEVPVEEVVE